VSRAPQSRQTGLLSNLQAIRDRWGQNVTNTWLMASISFIVILVAVVTELAKWSIWPSVVSGIVMLTWYMVSMLLAAGEIVHTKQDELTELRAALQRERESKLPGLKARIDRLTVHAPDARPGAKSLVFAIVSMANDGYQSDATHWEMLIGPHGSERVLTEVKLGALQYVEEIPDVNWSSSPPVALRCNAFDEDYYIGKVTATVIQRGQRPKGFFIGQIGNELVTEEDLQTIKLRCDDYKGASVYTALPVGTLRFGLVRVGQKSQELIAPYGFRKAPADAQKDGRRKTSEREVPASSAAAEPR
jgi:hypothetical protein